MEDTTSESVTLEIRPVLEEITFKLTKVRTISNLALSRQTLRHQEVKRYPHLKELPILAYDNVLPALLLGQDNWDLGLRSKTRGTARACGDSYCFNKSVNKSPL